MIDTREENRGILTWAEVVNGKISPSSLELLTPSLNLAEQLGDDTKVTTVLIGKDVKPLAKTLFEHGSDEVVVVEDDRLEEYLVLPFSDILTQVIRERKPEIAIFAATTAGRELAPRIGMRTGSGVTADCTGLEIGEYVNRREKEIIRPILHFRDAQRMVRASWQPSWALSIPKYQRHAPAPSRYRSDKRDVAALS